MYQYQKPVNPPAPSKQFPYLRTATNLIQALCRQKIHLNTKQAFDQLHRNSLTVQKKSLIFAKILNKLTARKDISNKKFLFGVFLQIKISYILAKRQKIILLKQKSRNQSSLLIANILAKNQKLKISQFFNELIGKSFLVKQRNTFKTFNLMNSIKTFEHKLLRKAFKQIKVESFNFLAKYKRCFVIERFYARKRVQNLTFALTQLIKKPAKIPQKQIQSIANQQTKPQQDDILKQLEEQKKLLQTQLNQLKANNRINLKAKETELNKMQSEYVSLRFNFEVMAQENSELTDTINERQRLASEAETRKKQQEENIFNKRSVPERTTHFNEHDMWKSIFDNLLCYLYKVKSGHDQSIFSVQKMLQKMTEPLISLSVYAQKAQLEEENEVLRDLLNSYKAAFDKNPSEELSYKQLPLEILNKQRRYLYLALDCLTRWGTTETQGLEEVKSVLQKIKEQQQNGIEIA